MAVHRVPLRVGRTILGFEVVELTWCLCPELQVVVVRSSGTCLVWCELVARSTVMQKGCGGRAAEGERRRAEEGEHGRVVSG